MGDKRVGGGCTRSGYPGFVAATFCWTRGRETHPPYKKYRRVGGYATHAFNATKIRQGGFVESEAT